MKKLSYFFTILLLISLTGSLSCNRKVQYPSKFLLNFSLDKTVAAMDLHELGLMYADVSSTMSIGPPIYHRQEKDSYFTIDNSRIDTFDDARFLSQLREKLSRQIEAAGLKVTGGGTSSAGTFDIEYQSAQFKGNLDLIGIRTARDKYRVWCVVRELDFGTPRA